MRPSSVSSQGQDQGVRWLYAELYVWRDAGVAQQPATEALVQVLADSIASPSVRGCDHPATRKQLLAVVLNTISWAGAQKLR